MFPSLSLSPDPRQHPLFQPPQHALLRHHDQEGGQAPARLPQQPRQGGGLLQVPDGGQAEAALPLHTPEAQGAVPGARAERDAGEGLNNLSGFSIDYVENAMFGFNSIVLNC